MIASPAATARRPRNGGTGLGLDGPGHFNQTAPYQIPCTRARNGEAPFNQHHVQAATVLALRCNRHLSHLFDANPRWPVQTVQWTSA
jgi:hypothetical protein